MAKLPRHPLLLLIIFISFHFPSSCDESTELISCLSRLNVKNFTLHPGPGNNLTAYFDLLNFSIQNRRFSEPTVPKPNAIIFPESKKQLVNSVFCCRNGSFEIRVRSGGHSYEGTSSVATDGAPFVVIDMMNLNRISMDLKAKNAWVEGGATVGETYQAISQSSNIHGFSAGSCPTVGMGGHISGGGFGLLSRKYGLAADNVVDALLIDAKGRLLNRKAMGEDVFWAIRGGGGGNWGVVYAWKICLLKMPKIVTVFQVDRSRLKHDRVVELVYKWQYVAPMLDDEFYLSVTLGAVLAETNTIDIVATFLGFYLGPRSQTLSILNRGFPELGVVEEDCKEMSWIESIVYFSGLKSLSDLKKRYSQNKGYFKAKSDYVKTPLSIGGITTALDILEKQTKGYLILDPYGGAMHKISSDSIAFPHRKGNLFMIQYVIEWEEEDNDKSDKYIRWLRRLYNAMTPYVSWGPRASYVNYMDLDLGMTKLINSSDSSVEMARVWGEKYFLKNYNRLVKAKTLIDPCNVFRHQQSIPPMPSAHCY